MTRLTKNYLFKRLTSRLIITFILLAIPGALLVGVTSYTLSRKALEDSVFLRLQTAAQQNEGELRRWIRAKKIEVARIAGAEFFRDLARTVRSPQNPDPEALADAYERLSRLTTWFKEGSEDFREVFLLTQEEGRVFLSTDKSHEGDYRINDSYYIRGKEGVYVQNVYPSPVTVEPSIVVSAPLLSNFGEKLGVLAVSLNLDRMDEILVEMAGLGQTGEAYLVDRFNNFVSAQRFGRDNFNRGVHSEGIDAAMDGVDGYGLYLNYEKEAVIGVYRWLEDLDLALMVEIHQSEAFASARHLGWSQFMVGMGITLALSIAIFIVSKKITRPILMIRDSAAKVAEGDISVKAPVVTGDEVGMLAASFNDMTDQLESLYSSLRTSEEYFRTVFRLSPDAIAVVRLSDETFVDINEGFSAVTGYSRDEIVGRTTRTAGIWIDDETRDEFIGKLAALAHLDMQEVRFVKKDGSIFIGSISARKVNISGEAHRISVIRDVTKLREAQGELRRSNTILQTQMELSMSGILVVDEKGDIVSFNRRYMEMWDIPQTVLETGSDELAARSVLDKIDDPDAFMERRKTLMEQKESRYHGEISLKDGRVFEEYAVPMLDEGNCYYGRVLYFRDITADRRYQANLRASVREKEVLLQEIHHRVKNNLQVISGLLDLQKHHITDTKGKEVYKESQNRVITMALIHEELYQARDLAQVDYGLYINSLVKNLFKSYAVDPDRIKLELRTEDVQVIVDTAIPCGLIINELVTNVLKHAFPNGDKGEVRIIFRQDDDEGYYLEVTDNGVGLPPDLDVRKSNSLGLQLVAVLVEQLSGVMSISSENGASFVIHFKEYREAGTKMY